MASGRTESVVSSGEQLARGALASQPEGGTSMVSMIESAVDLPHPLRSSRSSHSTGNYDTERVNKIESIPSLPRRSEYQGWMTGWLNCPRSRKRGKQLRAQRAGLADRRRKMTEGSRKEGRKEESGLRGQLSRLIVTVYSAGKKKVRGVACP